MAKAPKKAPKKKKPAAPSTEPSEELNDMFSDVIQAFKKHRPDTEEIVIVYGNLGYALGASIAGFKGKGPSPEEVQEMYLKKPNDIAWALMMVGLEITSWANNLKEK